MGENRTIKLTADQVAALDLDTKFRIAGKRTWYSLVTFSRNFNTVRLARIEPDEISGWVRQVNRYIPANWLLEVQLNEAATAQLLDSDLAHLVKP